MHTPTHAQQQQQHEETARVTKAGRGNDPTERIVADAFRISHSFVQFLCLPKQLLLCWNPLLSSCWCWPSKDTAAAEAPAQRQQDKSHKRHAKESERTRKSEREWKGEAALHRICFCLASLPLPLPLPLLRRLRRCWNLCFKWTTLEKEWGLSLLSRSQF